MATKLLRPTAAKLRQLANKSVKPNVSQYQSLYLSQKRQFSGPQEIVETRKPEDVEPDFWDAWHWEKIVEDIEFEIQHFDPYYSILPLEEFEYDLKFAKKMLEWRKLEEPKYLQHDEAIKSGTIESAFGFVGYKMRAEIDYRVIGGRGGVDTHENFYDHQYLYGPFGTEENPVLVPSRGRFRFVGCLGGYDGKPEHEVAWFALRQGPKHRCPMCGQIFQLWTTDSSHKDHPLHDPTFDYERQIHNMIH